MDYMETEQKTLSQIKLKSQEEVGSKQIEMLIEYGTKSLNKKTQKFDIEAYEQEFVNHALEKRRNYDGIQINFKRMGQVRLSQNQMQTKQKFSFLEGVQNVMHKSQSKLQFEQVTSH